MMLAKGRFQVIDDGMWSASFGGSFTRNAQRRRRKDRQPLGRDGLLASRARAIAAIGAAPASDVKVGKMNPHALGQREILIHLGSGHRMIYIVTAGRGPIANAGRNPLLLHLPHGADTVVLALQRCL
jgi:hypothetical protein